MACDKGVSDDYKILDLATLTDVDCRFISRYTRVRLFSAGATQTIS